MQPVLTLLVVNDQESEFKMLGIILEDLHLPVQINLRFARDRETALDYLAGAGRFSNRSEHPYPDWVLLDWMMPEMTWESALKLLRGNPSTANLPIAVLFYGFLTQARVRRAFELGANAVGDGADPWTWLGDLVRCMTLEGVNARA